MFNIGFGELALLAIIGLLVFGPDRLPDAVRKGSETIRQLRDLAVQARRQVTDAAGMDDAATRSVVEDLRELHPRRLAGAVLNPADPPSPSGPRQSPSTGIDPDLA